MPTAHRPGRACSAFPAMLLSRFHYFNMFCMCHSALLTHPTLWDHPGEPSSTSAFFGFCSLGEVDTEARLIRHRAPIQHVPWRLHSVTTVFVVRYEGGDEAASGCAWYAVIHVGRPHCGRCRGEEGCSSWLITASRMCYHPLHYSHHAVASN